MKAATWSKQKSWQENNQDLNDDMGEMVLNFSSLNQGVVCLKLFALDASLSLVKMGISLLLLLFSWYSCSGMWLWSMSRQAPPLQRLHYCKILNAQFSSLENTTQKYWGGLRELAAESQSARTTMVPQWLLRAPERYQATSGSFFLAFPHTAMSHSSVCHPEVRTTTKQQNTSVSLTLAWCQHWEGASACKCALWHTSNTRHSRWLVAQAQDWVLN